MHLDNQMLCLNSVSKNYNGKENVTVLNGVNLQLVGGKVTVIMGSSGSGKSTLMNIIGMLDNPSSGSVLIEGIDVSKLTGNERSRLRSKKIGFIFQQYNLFKHLTALENVVFPLYLDNALTKAERMDKGVYMLEKLGIDHRKDHYPNQMSGGEQQRTAIARSLINNPQIIIADEPTGSVDNNNEESILKILHGLSREGRTILIVTHSDRVTAYADSLYMLQNGNLYEEDIYAAK
ncbi:ABC transporter ATP-binding protein [Terribacillus saccharophilus]|jgi:putative ABC transport system ATP-binding protein|uniref:ABC transporter ATP-binding protein n=1 Tax=Terribacillus saccharophilus TaxID=361277 RepID=UPI0037F73D43